MSKDGLETYQTKYGGKAQDLLDEYKRTGDLQVLADVAVRYMHTRAGAEANDSAEGAGRSRSAAG